MNKQLEKVTIAGTVLGRRGTPEEIENINVFLASNEASYVTGALWFADGGTCIAKVGPGTLVKDDLRESLILAREIARLGIRSEWREAIIEQFRDGKWELIEPHHAAIPPMPTQDH